MQGTDQYLPNSSDIKYVNGGANKPPFREYMDYLDRQIALVGTGGLLTMLAESGSGTLAGGAHSETFLQIARGDAATLGEVLQRDVDAPLLAQAFPGAADAGVLRVCTSGGPRYGVQRGAGCASARRRRLCDGDGVSR